MNSPMHEFFGLSYAAYLVLPRTILQSASVETQTVLREALEALYKECEEKMPNHWPHQAQVEVRLKDVATKKYIKDDLADYQRGRRKLW